MLMLVAVASHPPPRIGYPSRAAPCAAWSSPNETMGRLSAITTPARRPWAKWMPWESTPTERRPLLVSLEKEGIQPSRYPRYPIVSPRTRQIDGRADGQRQLRTRPRHCRSWGKRRVSREGSRREEASVGCAGSRKKQRRRLLTDQHSRDLGAVLADIGTNRVGRRPFRDSPESDVPRVGGEKKEMKCDWRG